MNMYYTPNEGFGWTITNHTYDPQEGKTVIETEEGFEGDTDFFENEATGNLDTEEACAQHLLNLPKYQGSAGPIHGGGFPPKKH